MQKLEKKLYVTKSRSVGGRDGHTKSLENDLRIELSTPKELGGAGGQGANPEQLFACGYSACFLNAVKYICIQNKQKYDNENSYIDATVGIGPAGQGFALEVELDVYLPGLSQEEAEKIVHQAHQVCPYSNAVKGNIDVSLKIRTA